MEVPKEFAQKVLGGSFGQTAKKIATGFAALGIGFSVGVPLVHEIFADSEVLSQTALKMATGGSFNDALRFAANKKKVTKELLKANAHEGEGWKIDKKKGISVNGRFLKKFPGSTEFLKFSSTHPGAVEIFKHLATTPKGKIKKISEKFQKQNPKIAQKLIKSKLEKGGGWFKNDDGSLTVAGVSLSGLGAGAVAGAASMLHKIATNPELAKQIATSASKKIATTQVGGGFSEQVKEIPKQVADKILQGSFGSTAENVAKVTAGLVAAKIGFDKAFPFTVKMLLNSPALSQSISNFAGGSFNSALKFASQNGKMAKKLLKSNSHKGEEWKIHENKRISVGGAFLNEVPGSTDFLRFSATHPGASEILSHIASSSPSELLKQAAKFKSDNPSTASKLSTANLEKGGGWFRNDDGSLTLGGISLAGLGTGAVAGAASMLHSLVTDPDIASQVAEKAFVKAEAIAVRLASDAAVGGSLVKKSTSKPRRKRLTPVPEIKRLPDKKLYHGLHAMDQHAWEYMRESASQMLGRLPTKHWPKLPKEKLKHEKRHYEDITRIHTPQIAAKILENDELHGGGFGDAVTHVQNFAVDHFQKVQDFIKPFVKRINSDKMFPFVGPRLKVKHNRS